MYMAAHTEHNSLTNTLAHFTHVFANISGLSTSLHLFRSPRLPETSVMKCVRAFCEPKQTNTLPSGRNQTETNQPPIDPPPQNSEHTSQLLPMASRSDAVRCDHHSPEQQPHGLSPHPEKHPAHPAKMFAREA